jgi:FAD/FMN-containing dehydrogenase
MQVVVCPASAEDVARVVKFAARNSLHVATRGGGHSQTGQSLSDQIVLDMTSLNQVTRVTEDAVTAQAGIKWRALVEHLAPQRLSPPVLTNNLDVTVGGTLSMGGLGVASWRHGTQADNCLELEVVTGTGEIVRCSAEQNRDLFDAARCGAGQFGVITEAVLKVRRHPPRFRSFYLLYDDLARPARRPENRDERCPLRLSGIVVRTLPAGFQESGRAAPAVRAMVLPLHVTVRWKRANRPKPPEKTGGAEVLQTRSHRGRRDGGILHPA